MYLESWSHPAWRFLHIVTFTSPKVFTKEHTKYYRSFFENLQYVLPCPKCCRHFGEHFNKADPSVFTSMENLSRWLVDVHNTINVQNGSPIFTYEQAQKKYGPDAPSTFLNDMQKKDPYTEMLLQKATRQINKSSIALGFSLVMIIILTVMIVLIHKQNKKKI